MNNHIFITDLCRDSVTALTLNNLGLLLKQSGSSRWPEAEKCYTEAADIRK
jgi:hypothetical protein